MIEVPQGGTNVFHLWVYSSSVLTDLDAVPTIDVRRPNDTTEEVGVGTRVGVGHYTYAFAADVDDPTGSWSIIWTGAVGATPVQSAEEFVVVEPGVVAAHGLPFSPEAACAPWVEELSCEVAGLTAEQEALVLQAASDTLWARSGRRFGLCAVSVRPCASRCAEGASGGPMLVSGQWFNTCGPGCTTACSCGPVSEITLSPPAAQITSVVIDGEVLVAGVDYRLDGTRRLVRLGGERWPYCQDMTVGNSEVGAFTVNYLTGLAVPALGVLAANELSCEFARALAGDDDCKLPESWVSLVRQGVTIGKDLANQIDAKLGLYFCDLFVGTVNPNGLSMPSMVYPIDPPQHRQVSP